MAKRRFELPGIQDLSKEQEDARALPKEGQHLVIGGPGTGKSVLALLRARRYQRDGDSYVFLVYNHLLNRASHQLFGADLKSETWMRWFRQIFNRLTKTRVPEVPSQGSFRDIDWEGVAKILEQVDIPDDTARPYLIIDEGQDMPVAFYTALVDLGFEKFFVAADQNQMVKIGVNSNRTDIQNALGISGEDVIELTENYRNSYSTARLARAFWDGDLASPPPKLPPPSRTNRKPIHYIYPDNRFADLIGRILKMVDRNPRRLIGIIAPNNKVRERYLAALSNSSVVLDNTRPEITTYHSGKDAMLPFDEGGIMVINAQSCKGLEFDTVFLADINEHYYRHGDPSHTRSLFYVMVARAIGNVILLQEAGKHCPVDAIIPNDEQILECMS